MAFTQSMAIVVLGYAELKANGEMMMPRLPEMLLCCSELRLEITGLSAMYWCILLHRARRHVRSELQHRAF